MRFYDALMRYGATTDETWMTDALHQHIAVALRQAIVVDITNVAAFWHESKDCDIVKSTELPNVAPSFPYAFFEYRFPKVRKVFGQQIPAEYIAAYHSVESIGALLVAPEPPEEDKRLEDLEEYRWELHCLSFMKLRGEKAPRGPDAWTMLPVREDGSLGRLRNQEIEGIPWLILEPLEEGRLEELESKRRLFLAPVLLALCFLNCKNVALREEQIPPRVQRKHEKRYGYPLVTYKTLHIEPMKQVLRSEGGSDEVGVAKAMHICRGHFATYSPDRPLFGKYSGTFWKAQHVRGSKTHGEVVKDYEVNV